MEGTCIDTTKIGILLLAWWNVAIMKRPPPLTIFVQYPYSQASKLISQQYSNMERGEKGQPLFLPNTVSLVLLSLNDLLTQY